MPNNPPPSLKRHSCSFKLQTRLLYVFDLDWPWDSRFLLRGKSRLRNLKSQSYSHVPITTLEYQMYIYIYTYIYIYLIYCIYKFYLSTFACFFWSKPMVHPMTRSPPRPSPCCVLVAVARNGRSWRSASSRASPWIRSSRQQKKDVDLEFRFVISMWFTWDLYGLYTYIYILSLFELYIYIIIYSYKPYGASDA